MYDLHSNSGAIKLNQTGGMLRTGTIDISTVGLGKEAWSLREVWLQVLHGVGSQSAKAAIIPAFYFSDPVPFPGIYIFLL